MKISVIIPTYNEEKVLVECLSSLDKQTFKNFEVIVVDDGSSDKTWEILPDLKFNNYKLRILKQDHKGAGAARNLGARRAEGEILVFVDADMTFDKKFLQNLVNPIIEGKEKGTFSKEEYVENWESVWARCWNLNEDWVDKKRHPRDYPNHQPVFRAILKSEFEKVDGFTPGGYNDDWSLGEKLGYDAVAAPNAVFYHKNPSSLGEIFKHAKWIGKRRYKAGVLGYIIALVRSSFPISLIVGLYKGIINKDLRFVIFKIVYDFGIFVGILKYVSSGEGAK